ncbi:properdin-like [Brachyistius frenatus]|uniref:properdin-like n=1 Tax=Brachyistius frenatus TaxID=100188 RepID=UPI0037E95514
MAVLRVLQVLVLVLVFVERSDCVRCFARFKLTSGECDEEIGEVDEDDCCQNLKYGYQADGECQSCGLPVWSPWSSWSLCNVLCGDGVRQRTRKCFGAGQLECRNAADTLQMEPCKGTCCNNEGWDSWLSWSPCSVTCGGVGVRRRERVCSSPPECRSACSGSPEESQSCASQNACPVHGDWSTWSDWSHCSGSCIDNQRSVVIVPSRERYRDCSDPPPSKDTEPLGNGCPGDGLQVYNCSELPNCPVDGAWGAWSPAGKCSVSCGWGLQLSVRECDSPTTKYGGRFCVGSNFWNSVCNRSLCPVDGFWSGWSGWGACSTSCIPQGQVPLRTRHRSCSNPAPSSTPPGRGCQGDDSQVKNCDQLPHCLEDGVWGTWSPFTSCPVTCGVGLQVSVRRCDSPSPKHGGSPCHGKERQTRICSTNIHCPVDGVWSEWSEWNPCKYPFTPEKSIECKKVGGAQTRNRQCLHRAYNGSICTGGHLMDLRVCYDVNRCQVKGTWDGWETWSWCQPSCGPESKRTRKRRCTPDYSDYRPTIGLNKDLATFYGTPKVNCPLPPDGGEEEQDEPCVNVPDCN